MTDKTECKFFVGQVVHHRLFGYRGVVFDIDPDFQGSEAWYRAMARTRPPKDKPWYNVLVENAAHTTYVAERNLEPDPTGGPIDHPAVEVLFEGYRDGHYVPRIREN